MIAKYSRWVRTKRRSMRCWWSRSETSVYKCWSTDDGDEYKEELDMKRSTTPPPPFSFERFRTPSICQGTKGWTADEHECGREQGLKPVRSVESSWVEANRRIFEPLIPQRKRHRAVMEATGRYPTDLTGSKPLLTPRLPSLDSPFS